MSENKTVHMLYGRQGCRLSLPSACQVLTSTQPPPLPDAEKTVIEALNAPIGTKPLRTLLEIRKPASVAITISDITRPVPNRIFLPPLLKVLRDYGLKEADITIVVGTGMHRISTTEELTELVGPEILKRYRVIDHTADKSETLTQITGGDDENPPVSICRIFAEADFRIVTGYIEPHFMAGFSGGRKGVCPALVDLATLERFHGYQTLSSPAADTGRLEANPCHDEALRVAKLAKVDFILNVAIDRNRDIVGVFCGDLEAAHDAGCKKVAKWTTAFTDRQFDMVITNGGGYPLDQTFYQSVKGQCTALPAIRPGGVIMQISHCGEGLGSKHYSDALLHWGRNWRGFLDHISASGKTQLDQWQFQMQCRVLEKTGCDGLRIATDGIKADQLSKLALSPVTGAGDAVTRFQAAIDEFVLKNPTAAIAVIPEGPYTMIEQEN